LGATGDEEVVLRHTTITEVHITSTNSSYMCIYVHVHVMYVKLELYKQNRDHSRLTVFQLWQAHPGDSAV